MKIKNYSFLLVLYIISLSGIGAYLIGIAAPSYQQRQLIGIGLGALIMVLLSLIDYHWLASFGWCIYLTGAGLLLIVNITGAASGGAVRWIEIGNFRFQPSELAKILFILFFAWLFDKSKAWISRVGFLILLIFLMGIPILSILEQPDLSTSIIIAWTFLWMLFLAGLNYRVILKGLAAVVPVAALLLFLVTRPNQVILNDYQHRRIMAWLSAESFTAESYQQENSIMAIASGRIFGKTAVVDSPVSIIDSGFLPEPHTDFIMAVAGEELGFVGCLIIVILLLLIVLQCIKIGVKAADLTGRLICFGLAVLIGGQAFVNLCVVTGLLPNTGLTLPFVSYGLTSLISFYIGIGLVLNVGFQKGSQKES